MTRKRLFTIALAGMAAVSVLVVVLALIRSMAPTATANAAQEVRVPLSEVLPGQLLNVTWRGKNVIVLGDDAPRAFVLPYDSTRRVYLMPDPTWNRPFIECSRITFLSGLIQCGAPGFERSGYVWRTDGSNVQGYYPALESPTYVVQDGSLILGRQRVR